jgi:hypothetical protein
MVEPHQDMETARMNALFRKEGAPAGAGVLTPQGRVFCLRRGGCFAPAGAGVLPPQGRVFCPRRGGCFDSAGAGVLPPQGRVF